MTPPKWLIMHLVPALLFGWFAYKSRKASDRIFWLAVILINGIDYITGLIFPEWTFFILGA